MGTEKRGGTRVMPPEPSELQPVKKCEDENHWLVQDQIYLKSVKNSKTDERKLENF